MSIVFTRSPEHIGGAITVPVPVAYMVRVEDGLLMMHVYLQTDRNMTGKAYDFDRGTVSE